MASRRGYSRDSVRHVQPPKVLGLVTHFGKLEKGVEQHIVVDNLSPGEITTKFSKLLGL